MDDGFDCGDDFWLCGSELVEYEFVVYGIVVGVVLWEVGWVDVGICVGYEGEVDGVDFEFCGEGYFGVYCYVDDVIVGCCELL